MHYAIKQVAPVMKISYDPEIDALYIRLLEGKHECRTVRLNEEVALNIGEGEKLVGLEILDTRKCSDRGNCPRWYWRTCRYPSFNRQFFNSATQSQKLPPVSAYGSAGGMAADVELNLPRPSPVATKTTHPRPHRVARPRTKWCGLHRLANWAVPASRRGSR